jgi:hypothetical protein
VTVDEPDGITHHGEGHTVSSEVSERVRSVLAAAEAAASALRYEAEQDAQVKRRAAEEEAREALEDARRQAEEYLNERLRRIRELSDSILERGEQILARLDRADDVRRQFQTLVEALGESAVQLAAEAAAEPPPVVHQQPQQPESEPAQPAAVDLHAQQEQPQHEQPQQEQPEQPEHEQPEQPAEHHEHGEYHEQPAEPQEAQVPDAELAEGDAEPEAPRRDEDDNELAARLVALQMAVAGANRGDVEAHLQANFEHVDLTYVLDDVFGRGSESDKRVTWPETVRDTGS